MAYDGAWKMAISFIEGDPEAWIIEITSDESALPITVASNSESVPRAVKLKLKDLIAAIKEYRNEPNH